MSGPFSAARAAQPSPRVVGRAVHLTAASSIAIRPVHWLWDAWLALGTFALIAGREGIGKSLFAYTLAAQITRGRLVGAYFNKPRAVIVAASEDSWAHTIVPRLMAAGADLTRVFRVDVTTGTGGDTELSLPKDLEELEIAGRKVDASLVLLDPLLSRLDGSLDSHKDAEVRLALEPLVALADRTGITVLGLIHVNKSASTDALNTLMGSRAFAAVARQVLFVMADPDDESIRLLGLAKNNLGRSDMPTKRFSITGVLAAETAEGPVWTGKIEWAGDSSQSIRDVLETAGAAAGDRTATSEAMDWLKDYLSDQPSHSADSATIKREAAKVDHSKDALVRAKNRLGITCISEGFPRKTVWVLPVNASSGRLTTTASTAMTATTAANTHIHTSEVSPVNAVVAVNAVAARPPARARKDDNDERL